MAREQQRETTTSQEEQQQRWGTLEELLLACAVSRHGTKSWESIAVEVQNRSSTLSSLTPQCCRDKFRDLTQRFGFTAAATTTTQQDDAAAESASAAVTNSCSFLVPMVDQLRRIRVQELRSEVQQRDVSIVSLETKVKRLEEERERSLKAETDPEREAKASLEIVAGKSSAVVADSDERDSRSFNESNSTTHQKAETTTNKKQNDGALDTEERDPKVKPEPVADNEPVSGRTGDELDRDWSSNGKLNGHGNGTGNVKNEDEDENDKTASDGKMESENTKNNKASGGAGGLSESNEVWDESKREGREVLPSKQSSDVQSSASLSKSIRRRSERGGDDGGGAAGCSSSGEEPDAEEVSPATKKVLAVKSEPLVRLLGMIRSHRLGSHFERRLRSQVLLF